MMLHLDEIMLGVMLLAGGLFCIAAVMLAIRQLIRNTHDYDVTPLERLLLRYATGRR